MNLGLTLAILFVLVWVAMYVFRVEATREALPLYSASERLWVLLTPAILSVHFALASITLSATSSMTLPRALLGCVAFASGAGLWFWGRVAIGPLRVRRLPEASPLRFRRDGPFRIVRNPLYLGLLIAAGAQLLVAATAILGLTFVLCAIALAVRSSQEERRLHAQLGGAYADYCREVKRLIPFIW
jgi:protein-S-isoprenylcysteine O-methyltransferase Ste14